MNIIKKYFVAVMVLSILNMCDILALNVKIDGEPDDKIYQNQKWLDGFKPLNNRNGLPGAKTRFKIAHDKSNIYLFVEAMEPEMSKLVLTPKYEGENTGIWRHDSIEFAIDNNKEGNYFHKIIIDADGNHADLFLEDDNTGTRTYKLDKSWSSFAEIKALKKADRYAIELKIPFGSFNNHEQKLQGKWHFNVARSRYAGAEKEFSSFSSLSSGRFDTPWEFTGIEFPELKNSDYNWEAMPPRGIAKMLNGKLQYSVELNAVNQTGKFGIVKGSAVLLKNGREIASDQFKCGIPDGKFEPLKFCFSNLESSDYNLQVTLCGNSGNLIRSMNSTVHIDYSPVMINVIRPCYRNNIYASMPDKVIEAEILVPDFKPPQIQVELKGKDVHDTKQVEFKAGKANVTFNGAGLPDGHYTLRAFFDSNGKQYENKVAISKLPPHNIEVWLDSYGVTRINGERFLPFGWFRYGSIEPITGNNVFQTYDRYRNFDVFDKIFTEHGKRTNRYGILFPYQEMRDDWEYALFNSSSRMGNLSDAQRKSISSFTEKAVDSPCLLGWYLADEPEGNDENPVWYEDVYRHLRKTDPYHPCIMLNCSIAGINKYYKSCDILMPDCYPDFYEDATRQPMWLTSQITRSALEHRPAWMVIQAFTWEPESRKTGSPGRPPTFLELRNQLYQVFANDGKGVMMYDFHHHSQMFSSTRLGPDFLAAELCNAKDFLLDPNVKNALQVKTTPHQKHFQASLKMLDGRICVIAVNTVDEKVTAEFNIGQVPVNELFVLSEGRKVKIDNGRFSDKFLPYEAHIYLNSEKSASATNLKTIADAIAAFNKARLKPGNLAATGEISKLDYSNAKSGKFVSGRPEITASSECLNFYTRPTGTLSYLLDGICEQAPLDGHMCWYPKPDDLHPWVNVKLAKAFSINKIILYATAQDSTLPRLQSGRIQVKSGGEFKTVATFDNNTNAVLEFKIPPVKTNEIKLLIDKLRPYRPFSRLIEKRFQNGVLSEIEIYGQDM